MRVFKIQLNPDKKELVSEVYFREPKNFYEEMVGSLFLFGEIQQPSHKEQNILSRLWVNIQDAFYHQKIENQATAFRRMLQNANLFFEELAQTGNIGWIDKIHLAVLNIKSEQDQRVLRFSRVGETQIILERGGKISFLHERLGDTSIEPFPLTVFTKEARTVLGPKDRLYVFTHSLSPHIYSHKIIEKIALSKKIEERDLQRVFSEFFSKKAKGALLLIDSGEREETPLPVPLILTQNGKRDVLKRVSVFLKENFPFSSYLYSIVSPFLRVAWIQKIYKTGRLLWRDKRKKLIVVFGFLLLVSFLIGNKEEKERKRELKRAQELLERNLKTALVMGEGYDIGKANKILEESRPLIASLFVNSRTKKEKEKAMILERERDEVFERINRIYKIEKLAYVYTLEEKETKSLPVFLAIEGKTKEYFVGFKNKQGEFLTKDREWKKERVSFPFIFDKAVFLDENTIALKTTEGKLYILSERSFWSQPPFDIVARDISSFLGTLFILDTQKCQITKLVLDTKTLRTTSFYAWGRVPKCKNTLSINSDGRVYALQKDPFRILVWEKGEKIKERKIDFVRPLFSTQSELLTTASSPYLLIADYENNRIAVFNKEELTFKKQLVLPKKERVKKGVLVGEDSLWLLTEKGLILLELDTGSS